MKKLLILLPILSLTVLQAIYIDPPKSRFEFVAPLSNLPATKLDTYATNTGVAQQIANQKNLQARIIWIDATANLNRVSSKTKIEKLIEKIKTVGFNTIIYDVKPIVGLTVYPSKLTGKVTEWKGQKLPLDFDPLKPITQECKKNKIQLLVSLNAFSEGHMHPKFRGGPGFKKTELQTVLYDPHPTLITPWPFQKEKEIYKSRNPIIPNPTKINLYTQLNRIPDLKNACYISVNKNGKILQCCDCKSKIKKINPQGSILLGIEKTAEFLKENLKPTQSIKIKTIPEFVEISKRPNSQYPLMMNPHHPANQKRTLDFVKEILQNYEVDGIVFDDRLRFGGIDADFSQYTKKEFEKYVKQKVKWPNDVFEFTYTPNLRRGIKPGKFWDAWWTWRAMTLHNWLKDVRNLMDKLKPNSQLAIYAGSWFGEYGKYGANYASSRTQVGLPYLTSQYKKTGFAGLLDFMIPGCYYSTPTIYQAMTQAKPLGHTVEAATQFANNVIRDQTWTYSGIMLNQYYDNPKRLEKSIQAACWHSQGIMIFDLSHRIDQFWPIFEKAFKNNPKKAPHHDRNLLKKVKLMRAKRDKKGILDPPAPIYKGAAGTGF